MYEDDMYVEVKLFADLTKYGPQHSNIILPRDGKIELILRKYNLPLENKKLIILVNGMPHKTPATILKEGDTVAIFPPLAGG